MKLRPIGKRVVVKPKELETQTASGIYIPESAQEKNNEGTIVAIGTAESFPVKVGDRVLFEKFTGTELNIDGVDYIIFELSNIIGVLE